MMPSPCDGDPQIEIAVICDLCNGYETLRYWCGGSRPGQFYTIVFDLFDPAESRRQCGRQGLQFARAPFSVSRLFLFLINLNYLSKHERYSKCGDH